jgi:hypothetical protein
MRDFELVSYPKESLLLRVVRSVVTAALAASLFLFGYWLGYNS